MANNLKYLGSICLSDIPKEVIRKCESNGKLYLSFAILERKDVGKGGETHFISCSPKKELRREGVNYIIGDIKPFVQQNDRPAVDDVANMEPTQVDDLPW